MAVHFFFSIVNQLSPPPPLSLSLHPPPLTPNISDGDIRNQPSRRCELQRVGFLVPGQNYQVRWLGL